MEAGVELRPQDSFALQNVSAKRAGFLIAAFAAALLIYGWAVSTAAGPHAGPHEAAHAPSPWAVAPFVGILLSIAILPLIPATSHWWENNLNRLKVSLGFAAATLLYYLSAEGPAKIASVLDHAILEEYIPFILLLFSLYVISGGISLKGDLAAHPATNTAFLGVGAIAASFIGTTGASMLLIRPLLETNAERRRVTHTVIFFIFLVSNVGGCLLPIGDPPLFLGYLRGVPFLWTFSLWPEWLATTAVLLIVYFIWDSLAYRHESPRDIAIDESVRRKLTLSGKLNFLWLLGVVLCVAFVQPGKPLPLIGIEPLPFLREVFMLALAGLSLKFTKNEIRADNRFNYHAILEVAALFIGIFICMQVPIEILKANGQTLSQYLHSPFWFFWATGALSSFLDNAPTYAIFFETASSMTPEGAAGAVSLLGGGEIDHHLLAAVSLGAVFMGAMTYIGNGPNFMVKSIAEHRGVPMPSFFGYMLYSVAILIPLFLLVDFVFLR